MGSSASVKRRDSDDSSDDEECETMTLVTKTTSTPESAKRDNVQNISPKKKKKHGTFFTPAELQDIKEIEEMQKKATAFISKHFYYAVSPRRAWSCVHLQLSMVTDMHAFTQQVPVIIVRQSIDPYGPVFVQPDANLALER